METLKASRGGWTWKSSIGLRYGTGPKGQRETVAQPLMTSPWWVIGDDYLSPASGFVQIYRTAEDAMRAVADRGPQPGQTISTQYQPEFRAKVDGRWTQWHPAMPPSDDPDDAEVTIQKNWELMQPLKIPTEYRIVKVRRVVEREVKI